jgi:hypothetical protein
VSGLGPLRVLVATSAARYAESAAAEADQTLAAAELVGIDRGVVLWVARATPWGMAEIRRRLLAGEGPEWVKAWKEQQ